MKGCHHHSEHRRWELVSQMGIALASLHMLHVTFAERSTRLSNGFPPNWLWNSYRVVCCLWFSCQSHYWDHWLELVHLMKSLPRSLITASRPKHNQVLLLSRVRVRLYMKMMGFNGTTLSYSGYYVRCMWADWEQNCLLHFWNYNTKNQNYGHGSRKT